MDLLLGDYKGGHVFLRLNEGTAKAPKYATKNTMLKAAGATIKMGNVATIRMVDWDADGKQDLLVGTMGKSYPSLTPGSVQWFRNVGEKGQTAFAKSETILQGKAPVAGQENGSHIGFYFDVSDHDKDGDLDLLVGGKSQIVPEARKLSEEEQKRADELAKLLSANRTRYSELYSASSKEAGDRKAEGMLRSAKRPWRRRQKSAQSSTRPIRR